MINLLDNTTKQLSKFRTRNCAEINDESQRKYGRSSIKFKFSMTRSYLCDYSDAYILASGTMAIIGADDDDNAKKYVVSSAVEMP